MHILSKNGFFCNSEFQNLGVSERVVAQISDGSVTPNVCNMLGYIQCSICQKSSGGQTPKVPRGRGLGKECPSPQKIFDFSISK